MTEITRHFTATTIVVRENTVLLHLHAKQKLWLPPGGHIERDELPDAAARREVEEETGLRIRLHSEAASADMGREMGIGVVPQPAFILVEDINPFHQHIDFTYFALAPVDMDVSIDAFWRQQGFRWLSPEDLNMDGVPQNVRESARRAIAYFDTGCTPG